MRTRAITLRTSEMQQFVLTIAIVKLLLFLRVLTNEGSAEVQFSESSTIRPNVFYSTDGLLVAWLEFAFSFSHSRSGLDHATPQHNRAPISVTSNVFRKKLLCAGNAGLDGLPFVVTRETSAKSMLRLIASAWSWNCCTVWQELSSCWFRITGLDESKKHCFHWSICWHRGNRHVIGQVTSY